MPIKAIITVAKKRKSLFLYVVTTFNIRTLRISLDDLSSRRIECSSLRFNKSSKPPPINEVSLSDLLALPPARNFA